MLHKFLLTYDDTYDAYDTYDTCDTYDTYDLSFKKSCRFFQIFYCLLPFCIDILLIKKNFFSVKDVATANLFWYLEDGCLFGHLCNKYKSKCYISTNI